MGLREELLQLLLGSIELFLGPGLLPGCLVFLCLNYGQSCCQLLGLSFYFLCFFSQALSLGAEEVLPFPAHPQISLLSLFAGGKIGLFLKCGSQLLLLGF